MKKKILLTGATGYVGGLLHGQLLEKGYEVRILARSPEKVHIRTDSLIFKGDIRDPEALAVAMEGCEIAYYLVHGLDSNSAFEYEEAISAQNFTAVANRSDLQKIIYLGGLGEAGELSPHLRSRHLTGKILSLGKTPVTEFRASIVLGRESTSYGMMKMLVQRLPFLIDPPNLRSLCQPIGEEDLIRYLIAELERISTASSVFEIGGRDQCTYADLLRRVASHSGIHRPVFPVMEIEPRILAALFELICPEHARVGKHLMESLTYPTIQSKSSPAEETFPEIKPMGIEEALDRIGGFQSDPREILSKAHLMNLLARAKERIHPYQGALSKTLFRVLSVLE